MIKITIVSTKGGVGKTTITANLGGLLADFGFRVLLIDADSQPTLSSYYPLGQRAERGLTDFLVKPSFKNTISQTAIDNLDIVLSDDPCAKLRDWIREASDGPVRLKHILTRLNHRYDFVLIDTQGAVGPLQDAAVAAADFMLSPIPPEMLSAREFVRGTVAMIERLAPMALMGAPIGPLHGLIYRQDRTIDARTIATELRRAAFASRKATITILDTVIPNAVVYRQAATCQMPVHQLEPTRQGPTLSARDTMFALAQELVPNLPDLSQLARIA